MPADKVAIAYLLIVLVLIAVAFERVELWPWVFICHIAGVAAIVGLARWSYPARVALRNTTFSASSKHSTSSSSSCASSSSSSSCASSSSSFKSAPPGTNDSPLSSSILQPRYRVGHFLHGWHLVATIPATFMELSYLIPRIHPRDFDVELAAIDYRLFGVHPTVWLERFTWPPLTELLQWSYPTYYFLPIVLGAVLWKKGWYDRFYFWVFVIAFAFYLSYLGYFIVPAIGPRFLPEIVNAQTMPLTGVWMFNEIREALNRAEGITRDCFPSGHTAMSLVVLHYAYRLHRRTFWYLLPFGVAIIVSTVYLRYHYVIDIVAGALLALLVVIVSRYVYRSL